MSSLAARENAFWSESRLSVLLADLTPDVALEYVLSAEREVERIAPHLGNGIQEDVLALIGMCCQDEAEIFSQCREIGHLALRIVESARLVRMMALADTAKGVWEMTEALSDRGVWHTDALKLHVKALQALASGTLIGVEDIATIQQELHRMRASIGATAAS